jgi:hypothetical protein
MNIFTLPDYMKKIIDSSNESYKVHLNDKAQLELINETSVRPPLPYWVFLQRNMVPYSKREGIFG